eukprot:Phypoly_transcript_08237.p1 GENE.Phypoly_transcript_08237~~Phypoly_transcript_08237.p1  ORF type:complete len:428 (+),score=81.61 Phypoly_transcript_08237:93-1376(+)
MKLLVLFSLCIVILKAQELIFNSNQRDSCISTPCNIMDAIYWIPSLSPSPTTSLLISTPSVSLFLNISLSQQNVTLSNNSTLNITGNVQVNFQTLLVENSTFFASASCTTKSLQVLGTSTAYFGGGFGPTTIPFMEISENVTVTVERLLNVNKLEIKDKGILNLVGGGYTSVAQLSGNGTISVSGSQIFIGESVFSGVLNGTQGSTLILSNILINGSLLTDNSSVVQTSELGMHLSATAALRGGFVNSAKVSISPGGNLYVGGLLDLKAKSILEFDFYIYNESSPAPVVVNGSTSLDGSLVISLAGWTYNGAQTIKVPLISAKSIFGDFDFVSTPNTSIIPNRNPNATEIFYVSVTEQMVFLVYGTPPPPPTPSSTFFKKYWKIIAGAGGGGVAFLILVVTVACVVSRKGKKPDEARSSLIRTDNVE